ncbi:uncharacterized protein LOC120768807 [Bactrocera tryoni]|uniref:uncharacterized protein LOC120768807 n=1 Tax=Bactrocera tryoni TaxID=59916 RepID=UPI001A962AF0|nr:uncharacterized protein LOC120768807 [Bactrocera tryoni]
MIKFNALRVDQLNKLLQNQGATVIGNKAAKVLELIEIYSSEEVDAEEVEESSDMMRDMIAGLAKGRGGYRRGGISNKPKEHVRIPLDVKERGTMLTGQHLSKTNSELKNDPLYLEAFFPTPSEELKKRSRINGTFRWTERQTKDLLNIIVEIVKANPELFEKPTAQKFYEHITKNASTLNSIKWDVMCTKMRHLKTSFSSALKWKVQTGAGLLESGDVKSVEDYIKKMCPFYDDLYAIFGHRVNVQPPAIYQSTMPVSLLDTFEVDALMENDGETFSQVYLKVRWPVRLWCFLLHQRV